MGRVLGIGGVFYKAKDKPALLKWYRDVLGLDIGDWGVFFPAEEPARHPGAGAVISMFKTDTDYFDPSQCDFMINLVVDELDSLLQQAASQGVAPVKTYDEINGKFAHLIDPEGVKLELWEPRVTA